MDECKSRSLKLEEALGFFDSMISVRPLPSIWAFNTLLGAISKMEHYPVVVSMFEQMMGCQEMQPDIFTMTIFMNCQCDLKQSDLCFSVLASSTCLSYHERYASWALQ
ncbi:pentatricopeptide repeat-containing protein [Corchorus olitorius]|uniref:Pentatricopeptide repeat-containing protein n=1 Tax=Corchorus olitorius TaxID=93759 RepID=A0A1R3L0E1_9ROSI|nr:pentatricopeptide repeat-containing protein [Corchorus olitorius]